MTARSRRAAIAAGAVLALSATSPQSASAVELMKDLKCVFTQTTHEGADYCLKIFNTCNSAIASRVEEQGGIQKDSPEVRSGERDKVCTKTPFVFVGHYIAGPLAQGAGDY